MLAAADAQRGPRSPRGGQRTQGHQQRTIKRPRIVTHTVTAVMLQSPQLPELGRGLMP